MPRIRTVKPEFFTSLTIASLPLEARLTFIGLWTHVDDEGRCVDDTRLIRAAVWPLDERLSSDIETDLKRLTESSLIVRYEVDGRHYLAVQGWREHQKINRPTPSKLPAPPDPPIHPGHRPRPAETQPSSNGVSAQRLFTEESLAERKGKEGKGKEGKGTTAAAVATTGTVAGSLIGEWLEHCRKRPPGNVIGQVGKTVKMMLAEGIDPTDVRRGLAAWHSKGLHPSTLPSVVNQLMNATGTVGTIGDRPSTTDMRVNAALQLAARFDAAEVA